jgi:hypothetical protein
MIACIDPGENTGIVVFDLAKHQVILSSAVSIDECDKLLDCFSIDSLILEKKPAHDTWSDQLRSGYFLLQKWARIKGIPIHLITPGIWKPIAKANSWKSKSCKTQHEKDCMNMLRYWILVTYGISLREI